LPDIVLLLPEGEGDVFFVDSNVVLSLTNPVLHLAGGLDGGVFFAESNIIILEFRLPFDGVLDLFLLLCGDLGDRV